MNALVGQWTVVVHCPECGEWIAFNDRSTRRKCLNPNCKAVVSESQVKEQIEEERKKTTNARNEPREE